MTAKQALAPAAGHPYDPNRLEIFDSFFTELNQAVMENIEDPAPAGVAREDFAFFEAYFSNHIEGTTFEVEELKLSFSTANHRKSKRRLQQRADKKPGEWKERANQSGNTYFVVPELVVGSLREGYERIRALRDPLASSGVLWRRPS